MSKWKYQTEKDRRRSDYSNKLYLEKDKPKRITITSWEFIKNPDKGPLFKCFVVKEDNKEVDKVWSVWDFELVERIREKVKGKKADLAKVELTVVKKGDELEEYFELK